STTVKAFWNEPASVGSSSSSQTDAQSEESSTSAKKPTKEASSALPKQSTSTTQQLQLQAPSPAAPSTSKIAPAIPSEEDELRVNKISAPSAVLPQSS